FTIVPRLLIARMIHPEHHGQRAEHAHLHPPDIEFRISWMLKTTHAVGPVAYSGKAYIDTRADYRQKILPFAGPITCKDEWIALDAGISFTGMVKSAHTVVLLKLFIGCFG